ncbi:MAG: hypothetical protein R6W96_01060 [Clostridia bacterium]
MTAGENNLTKELLNEIMNSRELTDFLENNKERFIHMSLSKYLLKLIHEKNIPISEIIQHTTIEKSYMYQILNGRRNPSRNKLLQMVIAMGLDIEETQNLLKIGNMGILYAKAPRDVAIIYSIKNKYSLIQTQVVLEEFGFELLD